MIKSKKKSEKLKLFELYDIGIEIETTDELAITDKYTWVESVGVDADNEWVKAIFHCSDGRTPFRYLRPEYCWLILRRIQDMPADHLIEYCSLVYSKPIKAFKYNKKKNGWDIVLSTKKQVFLTAKSFTYKQLLFLIKNKYALDDSWFSKKLVKLKE